MTDTKLIGGGRPVRGCDVCGGVDDHPRHVLAATTPGGAGPPLGGIVEKTVANLAGHPEEDRNRVLAGILDQSSQDRHLDCCRSVGCPTGTCDDVAELVGDDLRGGALLKAVSVPEVGEELQDLFNARDEQGAKS